MNNPLVTVVIPTYNRVHFVGRAIQSVLDQTYPDFELLVVDDASTDETAQIVNDFSDHRIRYIRHPYNRGGSAARNTGIQLARGEYIALLDSDDAWLPQKLELQVERFQHLSTSVGVVYAGAYYRHEGTGEITKHMIPTDRGSILENLLGRCVLASPTPMIRAECFRKVGLFDEQLPSCQDWDMWIRISRHYEFEFVPTILAEHYIHDQRISDDITALVEGHERLHEKIASDLAHSRKNHSLFHFEHGNRYCHKGHMATGRKELLRAVAAYPFRVQYLVSLAASLLGHKAYVKLADKKRALFAACAQVRK